MCKVHRKFPIQQNFYQINYARSALSLRARALFAKANFSRCCSECGLPFCVALLLEFDSGVCFTPIFTADNLAQCSEVRGGSLRPLNARLHLARCSLVSFDPALALLAAMTDALCSGEKCRGIPFMEELTFALVSADGDDPVSALCHSVPEQILCPTSGDSVPSKMIHSLSVALSSSWVEHSCTMKKSIDAIPSLRIASMNLPLHPRLADEACP